MKPNPTSPFVKDCFPVAKNAAEVPELTNDEVQDFLCALIAVPLVFGIVATLAGLVAGFLIWGHK